MTPLSHSPTVGTWPCVPVLCFMISCSVWQWKRPQNFSWTKSLKAVVKYMGYRRTFRNVESKNTSAKSRAQNHERKNTEPKNTSAKSRPQKSQPQKSRPQNHERNFMSTKLEILYSGNFLGNLMIEISWKLHDGNFLETI